MQPASPTPSRRQQRAGWGPVGGRGGALNTGSDAKQHSRPLPRHRTRTWCRRARRSSPTQEIERRVAHRAPQPFTTKTPNAAAPTVCVHSLGLQACCPPASLPSPRGEPPRPAGVRKGLRVKALGVTREVRRTTSRSGGAHRSRSPPCAPGSPGALGVCPAEAPSRFRPQT